MKTFALLIFLLLLLSNISLAQTMDEIVDAGHVGNEIAIIKTIPTFMFYGEFAIATEVRIAKPLSMEIGVGWLPDYLLNNSFMGTILPDEEFSIPTDLKIDPSKSYSFYLNPKLFFIGENMNGVSIGPYFHRRSFAFQEIDEKLIVTEKCLIYSYQTAVNARLWLEFNLGFGNQKATYPDGDIDKGWIVPYKIKVGIGL